MEKIYQPEKIEKKIYAFWEKSGFFNPDKLPQKAGQKKFSIVLPPPNVTGNLHMGHALNAVLQDILIRWKRMQGFKTVWVPGTDHAGIATQNVVEKELAKEGKTRFDLGREKFVERVWQWKEKYGHIILEQLRKIGASCDWSREKFTMDKDYVKAIENAFLYYWKKGWIYRGERVVNWCRRCQTSLSDLEIEHKEQKGKLWYLKYPILKNPKPNPEAEPSARYGARSQKYIVVATTRPETMLGDMAVAVNPKDKRYQNLIGETVLLPLSNREIPIVADKAVDMEFGTGAVKVTPAHDLNDFQIAQRHNLKMLSVIDEYGKIKKTAPLSYQGLTLNQAREKVLEDLQKQGLIEKAIDYTYQIPKCYRCSTTIELIPSKQWFLRMAELAKLAAEAVKKGKVKFHPKRWEKVYFEWLKNIQDWCISRQIWWGHKIPIKGQTDVLDTWFSSALWPFAVFGWPQKTKDLKTFYPTDVLSTARDIINLWVARMVFSGIELTGKIPFKDVIVHATVLTKEGKRMSKSLGTGIDPMNLIEKYGADATRFGLTWQIAETQDLHFVEDNIMAGRKFCNKVWNAARFVLAQIGNSKLKSQSSKLQLKTQNLTPPDKQILKALEKTIKAVNNDLEKFRFGHALQTIYNFFWHDFCDKYIEKFKSQSSKVKSQKVLFYVLLNSLKLLHPFLPHLTEEIYQRLPLKQKTALIIEPWPKI